jgi:hypothetical protein
MADKNETKRQAVFTTVLRKDRTMWIRIGTAFTNRDGSLNVVLDALPVNGKLHIREVNTGSEAKATLEAPAEEVAA